MTPSGIILSSGSQGATQEAIEKVLTDHGYEPDKPETKTEEAAVEPKRDDFDSDEAFEKAQEEFDAKQTETAEKEEEEEEQKREEQERRHPKLTRRQRAVDKATKDLRDQLQKANERLAVLEGKSPKTEAAKQPEAPKREAFKTDAEFDEAMFDWRYKMRRAKEQTDAAITAQNDRLKENWEGYQAQVAEFRETHDDWDEVVNQPLPIHESVYLAVQEQENGAEVTYYLGKHPDYARKLAEMTPLSAVMEVGRLAERLRAKTGAPNRSEAGSGEKPKPRARIPEPVKPVSSSATSSTLTSREAAQKRDFRAFKAAQRKGV